MKMQWLLVVGVVGAGSAAFLLRGPGDAKIAGESSERPIPESAVAALQGSDELAPGHAGGQLPPGHPDIGAQGAPMGPVEPGGQMPDDDTHRGLAAKRPGGGPATVSGPKPGQIELAPGPNAKRIAELFKQRKGLEGKVVRVRGQVVKIAEGIMGTNFVHLQDGTGKAESSDNDLTVTMDAVPLMGHIVVVEGSVKVDYNLGAGYSYPVLLEKAKLVAK